MNIRTMCVLTGAFLIASLGSVSAQGSLPMVGPAIGPPSFFEWEEVTEVSKSRSGAEIQTKVIYARVSPDLYDQLLKSGLDVTEGTVSTNPKVLGTSLGANRLRLGGKVYDFAGSNGRVLLDNKVEVWVLKFTPHQGDLGLSIMGTWNSDWGPVTFEGSDAGVTGFWIQGAPNKGLIKGGSFDPQTRKLVFQYYQPWNDQNGKAELTLSKDGTTLSGTWTQQNGSGRWTMTR
jgi:hypothetical protein